MCVVPQTLNVAQTHHGQCSVLRRHVLHTVLQSACKSSVVLPHVAHMRHAARVHHVRLQCTAVPKNCDIVQFFCIAVHCWPKNLENPQFLVRVSCVFRQIFRPAKLHSSQCRAVVTGKTGRRRVPYPIALPYWKVVPRVLERCVC